MRFPTIEKAEDLARLVDQVGFLPFFRGKVPGLSVADVIRPDLWFTEAEGPWEWKGPVIRQTGCAYGKFFHGKAGFVSRAWFPHFANYRRDGYDFDAAYEDGKASFLEKRVYDALAGEASMLSKTLRAAGGLTGEDKRGFEGTLARLQSRGYVVTVDFEYALDRQGRPYGWGMARYATPERYFGEKFTQQVYACSPEESARKILDHLELLVPGASEAQLGYILG